MAHAENRGDGWRARYKRPDGSRGSQAGFISETAAKNWGHDQESLIRRNTWIDPRDAETPFGVFAEEYLTAISPRLSEATVAKYRSHLDNQLLPQWRAWPMIGIFNSYIEKWVSELHEDYAEPTVSSIFATFSTLLNAAVRARIIPASPCSGIRVTSGEYAPERLVVSPVQALRAAMRLYEEGLGLDGCSRSTARRSPRRMLSPHLSHHGDAEALRHVRAEPRRRRVPGGWSCRRASRRSTSCCSPATRIRSCSPRRRGIRGGGRTSGSGTGGEPGTASMPTTRVRMITCRRFSPGSPSMKAGTPMPPGSLRTAFLRWRAERG